MSLKTKPHCIRLNEETVILWELLKKHRVRPATIFKQAGERALKDKAEQLRIDRETERLPF